MSKLKELIEELCPEGVEYKRLEECCNILDRKRKPVTKAARESGNYPYYGANGIQDYVSDYIFDGIYVLIGEDGSVITPQGTPIINWAEGKIWVNNHAHIIEEKGINMTQLKKSVKVTIRDMAFIGVMAAVIIVCKEAMGFLPNIEPVSFWIILFTLFFGWKVFFVILVFILVEGCLYGMGLWWVMYFYVWPLLALLTYLNRKQESVWFWSILSGFFGLFFGFLCAIPYGIIGMASGGIEAGMRAAFAWWVAGIQWDVVHCIGNFAVMFILYRPMRRVMKRIPFKSN